MGIKFKDLFIDYREPVNLAQMKGEVLGIDVYVQLYQMLARIRRVEDGGGSFSHGDTVTSHLIGLFNRSVYMLENGLKLVGVFDGPPPDFKQATLAERSARKKEAVEKREAALEAKDMEGAAKYAQQTVSITDEIVADTKRLFDLLGIPYVTARHDAEAQVAVMTSNGLLDAAASQDYDTFLFGSPRVIRNLTVSQQRRRGGKTVTVVPEQFHLKTILDGLNLTREQLILVGMWVGTDFNNSVKGIGPKKALKLVQDHPTLAETLAVLETEHATEERPMDYYFPTDPQVVFDYFVNPPTEPVTKDDLKYGRLDKKGLVEFLVDDRGFSKDRVESRIQKLVGQQRQKSLSSFF